MTNMSNAIFVIVKKVYTMLRNLTDNFIQKTYRLIVSRETKK